MTPLGIGLVRRCEPPVGAVLLGGWKGERGGARGQRVAEGQHAVVLDAWSTSAQVSASIGSVASMATTSANKSSPSSPALIARAVAS